jgi:DNA helicase-2/ATP-dependent DNA helicase PcrA
MAPSTSERLLAAFARRGRALPERPYVLEATVETEGRTVDVLVGEVELVDGAAGLVLLDWRRSPLAAACLRHEAGEDYEFERGGRRAHGRVLTKRIVAADATLPLLWPDDAGAASTRVPMTRVAEHLDDEQRQALHHPPEPALLVSGGAGSGKTTVALHRLARLHRAEPGRFPRHQVQVVVSEPGLAEMTSAVLRELGLGQIDVATFEAWVARQAKRVLLDRAERVLEAAPAKVVALKRHPALRAALPGFVDELGVELAQRLDRQLAGRGQIVARWKATPGAHMAERVDALEAALCAESPENLRHEVVAAVRRERRRLPRVRADLHELFGDARRMAQVVAASGGELPPGAAGEVVAHTRAQLRATSDETFEHVDAAAKETLDGRSLDDGTPDEQAGSGDREDDAVALELLRLKLGEPATRKGSLRRPALLLVDETQDLTAIELGLLGRARAGQGSLTVSGDDAQQMAEGAGFAGWDAVLAELDAPGATRVALARNHRSRAPIVAYATSVLGPLAAGLRAEAAAAPGGAEVLVSRVADGAAAAVALAGGLRELRARRPGASVAVLAARPLTARALAAIVPPGVTSTTVVAAKGLEFDVVVVPDASADEYPDAPGARRRLYVACSRAIEQLWLIAPGEASPLLRS